MNTAHKQENDVELITDRAIATMLGMSKPWVRQERFKRRMGYPHNFDLDPIYIGRNPRYKRSDVLKWIETASVKDRP